MREATPPAHDRGPPPDLVRSTRTVEKDHGRIETRQLAVSRECVAHLGWPGAAQVCRIERTRETAGAIGHEVAEPLTEIREIFAENRSKAIAAARQGFL